MPGGPLRQLDIETCGYNRYIFFAHYVLHCTTNTVKLEKYRTFLNLNMLVCRKSLARVVDTIMLLYSLLWADGDDKKSMLQASCLILHPWREVERPILPADEYARRLTESRSMMVEGGSPRFVMRLRWCTHGTIQHRSTIDEALRDEWLAQAMSRAARTWGLWVEHRMWKDMRSLERANSWIPGCSHVCRKGALFLAATDAEFKSTNRLHHAAEAWKWGAQMKDAVKRTDGLDGETEGIRIYGAQGWKIFLNFQ